MALILSDDCSVDGGACVLSDVEPLYYGLDFGIHLRVNQKFAVEGEFVKGLSRIGEDTDWDTSIVTTGVYYF